MLGHITSVVGNVDEIDSTELQVLIERAAEHDMEAFQAIFELLNDRLFGYALSHTKSREDALDIVQETFIELWGALQKFHYASRQEFYGFVYVILKRKLYRNRKKAVISVELEERHIMDNYEIEVEDYRYLEKKMKTLPERYQELLRLRYWSSMTFREIASSMRINENTAKVWHHRAIELMRAGMQSFNTK